MACRSAPFLFFIIFSTSANDYFGLDKSIYDNLMSEEYSGGGVKEDIFLKQMWGKITEIIPPSVIIPALEGMYKDSSYDCSTETLISPKLGKIVEKRSSAISGGKIKLEILNELKIEHPVLFDYVMKYGSDNKPFPLAKFSFSFDGQNLMKLNLEIPDFTQNRDSLSGECLVTITHLEVTQMTKPNMDKCEEGEGKAIELAEKYWEISANKDDFFGIISDGLKRGIDERLKKESKFWICASDEFKKEIEETYEEGFKYSDDYQKYCHGVRVKNDNV